jgi:hypothetical protein
LTYVDENFIILTAPQFLNIVSVNPLTIDFGFTDGTNDPNRRPEMALNGIKKHYKRNLISDFLNKSHAIFFFNANVFPREDFFKTALKVTIMGKNFEER